MIVNQDIHPQRDLYYLGAIVLKLLGKSEDLICDYLEIYQSLNKHYSVSLNAYSLALDWLFLIGAIDSDNGGIKKCF